jgi:uncharacterized protein with ATP-grasp and redox domains
MAIMGNAIDLMVSDRSLDLEKTLVQGLEQPWPEKPFVAFKKKLEQTRSLVYLGDHCGEIIIGDYSRDLSSAGGLCGPKRFRAE